MQSYTQLAPEFFKNVLTPADMDIINTTVANPATIQAIIDYNKTQIMNNITKKVVKAFNDLGITCFGQTVKACQTKIGEFLDNNPECRASLWHGAPAALTEPPEHPYPKPIPGQNKSRKNFSDAEKQCHNLYVKINLE